MALRMLCINMTKRHLRGSSLFKSPVPRCIPCLDPTSSEASTLHTSQRYAISEDRETKSLALWSSVREIRSSPIPALTFGLLGLIPFVAAPTYMLSKGVFCSTVAFAQLAYGASILSFFGGIRWGFTLPEENPVQPNWVNLGYSITPSLVACMGLLLPPTSGSVIIMLGLAATAYCDLAMYGYPPWFKGLRFVLSLVAILSLWTVVMCNLLLSRKKENVEENIQPVQ